MGRHGFYGLVIGLATIAFSPGVGAQAEPFFQGPKKCLECHEAEYKVWEEGTKHFTSFKEMHKTDEAKAIVKAVGGKKNPKRNQVCTLCHYTMVQKDADAEAKARAGPSCESCHGASSDWFPIHDNFGGAGVKPEAETAEHRAERLKAAADAGMTWPYMIYDVALNCLSCHGMTNPELDGETVTAMLEAGHPINPEFELVRYSQGTVRHRFYRPDTTTNAEMTPAELARLFVTGHAASLVSATAALGKTDHAKYAGAQKARIEAARAALEAISAAVPEAAALLSEPSDANARAVVEAILDKDLTQEVGGMLPGKGTYK